MALLCAGAVGGFFWHKQRQVTLALENAEKFYAKQNWAAARRNYAFYLRKNPENVPLLLKYADCCNNIMEDRPKMLRDMSVAYYQAAINQPGDAEAVRRLIEHCMAIPSWSDVEYYAARFLAQDPGLAWLTYCRAQALEHLDRRQEAADIYAKLIEAQTEFTDVYGRLASIWKTIGFESRATGLLDDLVAGRPDDAMALLQRARYRFESGNRDAAQEDADKALALKPDDPELLLFASRLATARKQWPEAIALAERALPNAPKPIEAYVVILSTCQEQGEIDKALSLIDGMDTRLRADNPEIFVCKYELLILENKIDDADKTLEEYRKVYPRHTMVFEYMEARKLLAQGNALGATAKLTTVTRNLPGFRQAGYFLAIAYLQSDQREWARSTLETLCRNAPDFVRARALYQREFGPGETAAELVRQGEQIAADPGASVEHLVAAAEAILAKDTGKDRSKPQAVLVQNLLEKAIQKNPAYGAPYSLLADLYLRTGETAQVSPLLERAAAANVPSPEIALVRAGLALAENRPDDALKVFADEVSAREMPVDEVRRWANSFAARGNIALGLSVLTRAMESLPPDKARTLATEQATLCTRFGDIDGALRIIAEIETRAASDPELAAALLNEEELLIELLLQSKTPRYLQEAKRLVEHLCTAKPDEVRYRLLEGRVLASQDPPDYDGAQTVLAPLLDRNPRDSQVLMTLADLSMRRENLVAALDYAQRASGNAPQDMTIQLALAEIQMRSKLYAEAQATLENVLAIVPKEIRALELLIDSYLSTRRLEHAQSTLQRVEAVLSESPEDAWRLALLRGKVAIARGENVSSVEEVLRARYVANPDDIEALRELAVAVQRQGRASEAEQLLTAFADNNSGREDAWVMLGHYYLAGNTPESLAKASSAFTRALIVRPNYLPALAGLIDLGLRTNSGPQVLMLCDRYLEIQPMSPEILYRKAVLLAFNAGKNEDALACIQQAIALNQRTDYLFFRGTLYLTLQRYREALDDLLRVNQTRDVGVADLDLALAEAYLGTGDRDAAAQYYQSAKRKIANGAKANPQRIELLDKELADKKEGGG